MDLIRATLEGLELGPPVEGELLTVYPLLTQAPAEPWYDLAREAFTGETLEISEVSEGGTVPTLTVTNRGARSPFTSTPPMTRSADSTCSSTEDLVE